MIWGLCATVEDRRELLIESHQPALRVHLDADHQQPVVLRVDEDLRLRAVQARCSTAPPPRPPPGDVRRLLPSQAKPPQTSLPRSAAPEVPGHNLHWIPFAPPMTSDYIHLIYEMIAAKIPFCLRRFGTYRRHRWAQFGLLEWRTQAVTARLFRCFSQPG